MSKATGRPFFFGVCALVVAVVFAVGAPARADVTTDQSGSILIFPKVISDGVRDTLIQISNTGNTLVHAKCYYVDGETVPVFGGPPQALWQATDFFIWLTRQQPTQWSAARGRPVNPSDPLGTPNAGIDPGSVPPTVPTFEGELVCIEIGADGLPVSGNKLKGEATLKNLATGDVSKYNAIAIKGGPAAGATDNVLQLDNDQYNSCPQTLLLDSFTEGATEPVIGPPNNLGLCAGGDCDITTELTLVPCQMDFENAQPGSSTIQIFVINEFEQTVSATLSIDCWFNESLAQISSSAFSYGTRGTLSAYARLQRTSGSGFIGVAEEFHRNSANTVAAAAYQLQIEGSRFNPDEGRDTFDSIIITRE